MQDLLDRLKTALADRYAIEREIGAGGMATVYLAEDLKHHRKVAIKVLKPAISAVIGSERFGREIDIAATLNHPHILTLIDSGNVGGTLYYVMPHVEGESLRGRLDREPQLPLDDVVQITTEVASALSYAHSRGVVHRDIKPENILFSAGLAIVADFGIARAVSTVSEDNLTDTGLAIGTPAYMSPEQAAATPQIDARSDIYSLACVVYEMLGGETPYTGATPQAVLARQLEGDIRPLSVIRTSVSLKLDAVLNKALSPSPADRYTTISQFSEALSETAGSVDMMSITRPSQAPTTIRLPSRRVMRRVASGLSILAITALAIMGGAIWFRPSDVIAVPQPASLAVFPFRGTGPDAGTLGEGVADLLVAVLDGTVGVRVADPGAMWRSLRQNDGVLTVPGLDEAVRLASPTRASTIVLGSITVLGDQLAVTARLYDRLGRLRSTARAETTTDSLASAVNRLAIDILADVWERDSLPTVPAIQELATDSHDALKAYLEAKQLSHRGQYEQAEAAIERAVALDSTFALAHLEHYQIRAMTLFLRAQPLAGLMPIIARAEQYQEKLSPRNRRRVQANKFLDLTMGSVAAVEFDRILQIDSLDLDAWLGLAYTYATYGWQLDLGIEETIAMYEQVVRLDPNNVLAHGALARIALWTGDDDRVERGLAGLRSADTTAPLVAGALTAIRAVRAEGEEQDRVLHAIAQQPLPVVTTAALSMRALQPKAAERLFEILQADSMPTEYRMFGSNGLTQLRIAQGRLYEAERIVQANELDIVPTLNVHRALVNSYLAGIGDSGIAHRALQPLRAHAPRDSLTEVLFSRYAVWADGWTIGAYEAAHGSVDEARLWQQALEELPAGDTPWDWREALSADLEARIAARNGDLSTALREARRAYRLWTIHAVTVAEWFPEPAMRFQLAELLYADGAQDEAAGLYESFTSPYSWMGFYSVRASLRLAEIAEAKGDLGTAQYHYTIAVALLDDPDPMISSWKAKADEGLRRVLGRIG